MNVNYAVHSTGLDGDHELGQFETFLNAMCFAKAWIGHDAVWNGVTAVSRHGDRLSVLCENEGAFDLYQMLAEMEKAT
jgi:hypothetical protein